MVFTVRMVSGGGGHTRRTVLGRAMAGALSLSVAGCSVFDDAKPEPPDPLQPVLAEAVALAAALDQAALTVPDLARRLTPLAADHRAHAAALSRVIGKPVPSAAPSASGPAAGSDPATLLKQLRTSVQAAQRNAAAACRQAPADRAMLVGSIAAGRATHVEALR
jgi:hypothetical protein